MKNLLKRKMDKPKEDATRHATIKSIGMTFMSLFFAGVAVVIAVVAVSYISNLSFEEKFIQVQSDKVYDKMRIIQLSDLHGTEYGAANRELIDRVENLAPDLIVMTGDMIDDAKDTDRLLEFCEALAAISPTYYIYGNNEVDMAISTTTSKDALVAELSNWKKEDDSEAIEASVTTTVPEVQPAAEAIVNEAQATVTETTTSPIQSAAEETTATVTQPAAVTDDTVNNKNEELPESRKRLEKYLEKMGDEEIDSEEESEKEAEERSLEERLESVGVKVLLNSYDTVEIGKNKIDIFGLLTSNPSVFWTYAGEAYCQYFYDINPENFKLFLAHEPEIFNEWHDTEPWGDLVLCGHTHGGVIRIPRLGALYAQENGFLPERSGAYVKGRYRMGHTPLVVSGGLTNKGMVRINNKPEMVIVDVKRH